MKQIKKEKKIVDTGRTKSEKFFQDLVEVKKKISSNYTLVKY